MILTETDMSKMSIQSDINAEKKFESQLHTFNKILFIHNILGTLLAVNSILVLVVKEENFPKIADKLIFAGFVLAWGVIGSLIALANSFNDDKDDEDEETKNFIEKTLKEDAKFKKEFDKYVRKQNKREGR